MNYFDYNFTNFAFCNSMSTPWPMVAIKKTRSYQKNPPSLWSIRIDAASVRDLPRRREAFPFPSSKRPGNGVAWGDDQNRRHRGRGCNLLVLPMCVQRGNGKAGNKHNGSTWFNNYITLVLWGLHMTCQISIRLRARRPHGEAPAQARWWDPNQQ